MVVLNQRERRVLLGLGIILLIGGAVRLGAARWPQAPGLASERTSVWPEPSADGSEDAPASETPPSPPVPRFGDVAHVDSLFPGGKLDLNAAGVAELILLPGIGPALAGRMVEMRRQRGGFSTVDEIQEVRGVGPATLKRLRPLLVVRPGGGQESPAPSGPASSADRSVGEEASPG